MHRTKWFKRRLKYNSYGNNQPISHLHLYWRSCLKLTTSAQDELKTKYQFLSDGSSRVLLQFIDSFQMPNIKSQSGQLSLQQIVQWFFAILFLNHQNIGRACAVY